MKIGQSLWLKLPARETPEPLEVTIVKVGQKWLWCVIAGSKPFKGLPDYQISRTTLTVPAIPGARAYRRAPC